MTEEGRPRWKPRPAEERELHPTCANCGYQLWRHDYDAGNYWCPPEDKFAMIPTPDEPPFVGRWAAGPVTPPVGPASIPQRLPALSGVGVGGPPASTAWSAPPLLLISLGPAFLLRHGPSGPAPIAPGGRPAPVDGAGRGLGTCEPRPRPIPATATGRTTP